MYVKRRLGLTIEDFRNETKHSIMSDSVYKNSDEQINISKYTSEQYNNLIQSLIDNPNVNKFGEYLSTTYVPGYYNRYILVKYIKRT